MVEEIGKKRNRVGDLDDAKDARFRSIDDDLVRPPCECHESREECGDERFKVCIAYGRHCIDEVEGGGRESGAFGEEATIYRRVKALDDLDNLSCVWVLEALAASLQGDKALCDAFPGVFCLWGGDIRSMFGRYRFHLVQVSLNPHGLAPEHTWMVVEEGEQRVGLDLTQSAHSLDQPNVTCACLIRASAINYRNRGIYANGIL